MKKLVLVAGLAFLLSGVSFAADAPKADASTAEKTKSVLRR